MSRYGTYMALVLHWIHVQGFQERQRQEIGTPELLCAAYSNMLYMEAMTSYCAFSLSAQTPPVIFPHFHANPNFKSHVGLSSSI